MGYLILKLSLAPLFWLLQSVNTEPSCSLGPLGLFCLQSYAKVDWRGFKQMAVNAESPSAMINWSDDRLDQWFDQLSSLCAPFNQVSDCTSKQGGRRWWNCMDDVQMKQLLEQFGGSAAAVSPETNFPHEPSQLRDNFDALTDICDAKLSQEFKMYHPCMRTAFNDQSVDSVLFRKQIQEADEGLRTGCMAFGCGGAFTYTNIFVYWVNAHCGIDAADTAFKLMGSSIRLQMMSQKTYCDAASYPREMDPYVLKPVKKPAETLDRKECVRKPVPVAPAPTVAPKPVVPAYRPPATAARRIPVTARATTKTTQRPSFDSNELESAEIEEDANPRRFLFQEYHIEFMDISDRSSQARGNAFKISSLLAILFIYFY